jgi:regulatory protein
MQRKGAFRRAAVLVGDRLTIYACPSDAEALAVGHVIAGPTLTDLHRRYQRHQAYLQAVRFLAARDRSTQEVDRHLAAKGWEASAVRSTIDRLREEGYLDDRVFAEKWVAHRVRTAQRSRLTIMQELKQKGIAQGLIRSAVAGIDEGELALACAKKKGRQWLRYAGAERTRRIVTFLQRKGFPYTICRHAADTLVDILPDN